MTFEAWVQVPSRTPFAGEGVRAEPAYPDVSSCLKIMGFITPRETGAIAMLDKPISPLRQRMIEDMTARRFKEKVQKDYIRDGCVDTRRRDMVPRHLQLN
jgi:hypothetical protein